jgi:hypothetical protein
MTQDRRGFLQSSLAAGAVALAGGHAAATTSPGVAPADRENRRVRPGRVTWHEDFAAACAASERSGKPVLLFQMMGRMDQKFC